MGNALKSLYEYTASGDAWFQFENAWRNGMIPNLWEAIAATEPARRQEFAAEFAMIDLEWRWRHNIYNEPRDVAHYIELLQPLSLRPEKYLDLVEHAFIVRSQWGDRPTVDAMMDGLPPIDSLRSVLQVALMENFPTYVSVTKGDEIVLEGVLNHVTHLGQQRAGEPTPYALIERSRVNRFVVAEAGHASILPVAVEIVRASAETVEIQNFAPRMIVAIDGTTLKPNEPRRCTLPTEMRVEDLTLHIVASE